MRQPDHFNYCILVPNCSVADTHHFDADPDPDSNFHCDADPDPDPSFQIKAQNIEKVLK